LFVDHLAYLGEAMTSMKKCCFPECEFGATRSQSLLFHIIEEHRMKRADNSLVTFDENNFVPVSKGELEESRKSQTLYEAAERRAAITVRPRGGEALPPDGLKRDDLPRDTLQFDGLPRDVLIMNQSAPVSSGAQQYLHRSDHYSPHCNDNRPTYNTTSTYRGGSKPWRGPCTRRDGKRRWTDYNRHNRSPERTRTNNYYEESNQILPIITPQAEWTRNLTRMKPTPKKLMEVNVKNRGNYVIPKRKESFERDNQSEIMTQSIKPNEDNKRGNEDQRKYFEDDRQDCVKTSTSTRYQMGKFPNESLNKKSRKFEPGVQDSIKLNNQLKITDAQKRDSKIIQTSSVTDTLRVSSVDQRTRFDIKKKEIEGDVRKDSKVTKSVTLYKAICPSTASCSVSNDVTLSQPGTSVSSVESRSDPLATRTLNTEQKTWTLSYSGVVEMLEILTNFPLPWIERKLFKAVSICMCQYHTTHLSNTLQIVCKTSKVVQEIIGVMPSGTPKTPKTPLTGASLTFCVNENVKKIPNIRPIQESLNSKVVSAMLDILITFPLPWNQKRLNPVILRSMGEHSCILVTNTLQIVCKACDVVRMMADLYVTDDEPTINSKP